MRLRKVTPRSLNSENNRLINAFYYFESRRAFVDSSGMLIMDYDQLEAESLFEALARPVGP